MNLDEINRRNNEYIVNYSCNYFDKQFIKKHKFAYSSFSNVNIFLVYPGYFS